MADYKYTAATITAISLVTMLVLITSSIKDNFVVRMFTDSPKSSESAGSSALSVKKSLRDFASCTNEARKRHMDRICSKNRQEVNAPLNRENRGSYNRFMVDDAHRVLYCAMPKAGSTSWKSLLIIQSQHFQAQMDPFNPHRAHNDEYLGDHGIRWLKTLPTKEVKRRLDNYYKFLVVRHPYERLYSAYADKLAGPLYPTFRAFLEAFGAALNSSGRDDKALARLRSNIHLQTEIKMCPPCVYQYDYIAKVETMSKDSRYLLPIFNSSSLPTQNVVADTNDIRGIGQHSQVWISDFNNLSMELKTIYAAFFEWDLKYFGYGWDDDWGPVCNINNPGGNQCC